MESKEMDRDGTIIITGASGGIGRALTRALARHGKRIIMACRNLDTAEVVRQAILAENNDTDIETMPLDLASLKSVRHFTQTLTNRNEKISVLINNAGVMNKDFRRTEEGFEHTVGVNYLATSLLTIGLLPLFETMGTIVNTVSCTYRMGEVGSGFFDPDERQYRQFKAYGSSKLALLLFSLELAERYPHLNVYAVDPGVVDTGMITMHRWFDPLADLLFRPFIKSPEKGAATTLSLVLNSDPVSGRGGGDSPTTAEVAATLLRKNGKAVALPDWVSRHPRKEWLWNETKMLMQQY